MKFYLEGKGPHFIAARQTGAVPPAVRAGTPQPIGLACAGMVDERLSLRAGQRFPPFRNRLLSMLGPHFSKHVLAVTVLRSKTEGKESRRHAYPIDVHTYG